MITSAQIETDEPGVFGPAEWPAGIVELAVSAGQYHFTTADDVSHPSVEVETMPVRAIRYVSGPFTFPADFFGLHFARYPTGSPVTVPQPGLSYSTVRSHDKNGLTWASINPSDGVFYWDTLDAWVAAHSAAARDMIFTVFGTPTWASARPSESGVYGLGSRAEPASMSSLSAFVAAVAARYPGQIKYWEVWNEPNNATFYSGTRAKLVEMAVAIKTAAKSADATCKIIGPAVTNFSETPNQSAETYFRDLLGTTDGASGTLVSHVDIIGVHLYVPGGDMRKLIGIISNIKSACAANGAGLLPIWDTESGVISPVFAETTAVKRRKLFARQQIIAASLGIERSCWYGYDYASYGFADDADFFEYREALIRAVAGRQIDHVVLVRGEAYVSVGGNVLIF